jgi:excisionase family DNA binding protein
VRVTFQASHPSTGFSRNFATPVLPGGRDQSSTQKKSPAPCIGRNDLLTAKEVAARLRVCTATVYKLCASGALPHVRVLNAVRVDLEELDRFLTRQSQKGIKS